MNMSLIASFSTLLPHPLWQKILVLIVSASAIIGLYFWLLWGPLDGDINAAQQRLHSEEMVFQQNQRMAQDLERKKLEYTDLEKELKFALSMLPKKSELPKLLEDITWAGKQSGLEFRKFKPGGEKKKKSNFYADMPIDIEVFGSFKNLMVFLAKVGELPRIVDIQRLNLKRADKESGNMQIKGRAMTYRFIESGNAK